MITWQFAIVLVCALLVGLLVPVIIMFAMTLNTIRKQISLTGSKIDSAVDEIHKTATRLAVVSKGLEGGEEKLQSLLTAIGKLAETIEKVNHTAKMTSTVIAAVVPMVSAFMATMKNNVVEGTEPVETKSGKEQANE